MDEKNFTALIESLDGPPLTEPWVNDGKGNAHSGDYVIELDGDRWKVSNWKTGDLLISGEVDDGGQHPLIARLANDNILTAGLEEWTAWAEEVATATGPFALFDVGDTDLQSLLLAQSSYMWLDSADPTLVTLAAAATSDDGDGEPLWLMLVGPSSGGKGERLRIIDNAVNRRVKDLTLAGLITLRNVGKGKFKVGGLLPEIGDEPALVTITDFSALLSPDKMSGGQKMEVFNAFRDIYDGEYDRTMNGGTAHWEGRLTLIAACTTVIDQYAAHSDALGTRWLYYRLPERDDDERRTIAQLVTTRGGALTRGRQRTAELAARIIDRARVHIGSVELDRQMDAVITECALLTSYGRSSVPREAYGTRHEISDVVEMEEPGRVTHQLRRLARGLTAVGCKREVVERIVKHAALSSIPKARGLVLSALWEADAPVSTNGLAATTGLARKVAHRAAEDLEATGLIVDDAEPPDFDQEGKHVDVHRWGINPDRRGGLKLAL